MDGNRAAAGSSSLRNQQQKGKLALYARPVLSATTEVSFICGVTSALTADTQQMNKKV